MAEESTITQVIRTVASAAVSGVTGGGVVTIIGQGFTLANKIIDYIDNPAKRAKARREYLDALEAMREKIKTEQGLETIDRLLLDLIAAVHTK
jgi:hypothetical protein